MDLHASDGYQSDRFGGKERIRRPRPGARLRRAPRMSFAALPVMLCVPLALFCSISSYTKSASAASAKPRKEAAQQLVRDVVWNEIHAQSEDHSHWRFHETQWHGDVRKLYDVIQTKYGDLHRLLAINGRHLEGQALDAENSRIEQLASEPQKVAAAQKKRDSDAKQEQTLLQMLPNAFLFHEAGQQGDVTRLSFAPDPAFHPSSHEAEVFHHMEGTMLVDSRMKRLLQIDGRLTTPVNFWGGILGHLDAGGTFKVEQRDVGDGHWDMVYLRVNMDGKALFFKTISVHQHEAYSDYHKVPDDLNLQKAADELQKDVAAAGDASGE
jgi:hypothetical protein